MDVLVAACGNFKHSYTKNIVLQRQSGGKLNITFETNLIFFFLCFIHLQLKINWSGEIVWLVLLSDWDFQLIIVCYFSTKYTPYECIFCLLFHIIILCAVSIISTLWSFYLSGVSRNEYLLHIIRFLMF